MATRKTKEPKRLKITLAEPGATQSGWGANVSQHTITVAADYVVELPDMNEWLEIEDVTGQLFAFPARLVIAIVTERGA